MQESDTVARDVVARNVTNIASKVIDKWVQKGMSEEDIVKKILEAKEKSDKLMI